MFHINPIFPFTSWKSDSHNSQWGTLKIQNVAAPTLYCETRDKYSLTKLLIYNKYIRGFMKSIITNKASKEYKNLFEPAGNLFLYLCPSESTYIYVCTKNIPVSIGCKGQKKASKLNVYLSVSKKYNTRKSPKVTTSTSQEPLGYFQQSIRKTIECTILVPIAPNIY